MRLLHILCGLLLTFAISAQDSYFTIYNFTAASKDVPTVYKLMDDYFSENKAEGITVTLYENHFSDSKNNFSHSVVFSGTSDALGGMYGGGQNSEWTLFLTRVNMHTDGFSSAMGETIAAYGDNSTPHPIQKYFIVDVEDGDAFKESFDKYQSAHTPTGQTVSMGSILSGHSDDGANHWVVSRYKDFKTAIKGTSSLRTEAEIEASKIAWEEFKASRGEIRLVRSGLRIQLGQW